MSALTLIGTQGPRGAHNGLHASLAGGTLHPPAPCSPDPTEHPDLGW